MQSVRQVITNPTLCAILQFISPAALSACFRPRSNVTPQLCDQVLFSCRAVFPSPCCKKSPATCTQRWSQNGNAVNSRIANSVTGKRNKDTLCSHLCFCFGSTRVRFSSIRQPVGRLNVASLFYLTNIVFHFYCRPAAYTRIGLATGSDKR